MVANYFRCSVQEVNKKLKKLLEKLTTKDAMEIFGISTIPNAQELKILWKELSKLNHPDRGGSLDVMKDMNAAYDILLPLSSKSSSERETPEESKVRIERQRKERVERNKIYLKTAEEIFEENFDEDKLLNYLQQFTEDELDIDIKLTDINRLSTYQLEDFTVTYNAIIKVHNEDNTTVFYVNYMIEKSPYVNSGLSNSNMDEQDIIFDTSIVTDVYYDSRKYKLSQSTYKWRVGKKVLSDYEEIFPYKKIEKIFSENEKKSFKKADMLLGLKRELDVSIEKDIVFIYPFGQKVKYYICFSRSVMLKIAIWTFINIQAINPQTNKYYSPALRFKNLTFSIYETEETLRNVVKSINELVLETERKNLDYIQDSHEIFELNNEILEEYFPKNH